MALSDELNLSKEIARRIRGMREIMGLTPAEMAEKTETTREEYLRNEAGETDLPFSFIHKCALVFGIDIADLLEGHSPRLTSYQVTRGGAGQVAVDEDGILIKNLASKFADKIAEPYIVTYEYAEGLQNLPIRTNTHSGQEFDYILSGSLKVRVGDHIETLVAGDSILYNSSTPHGMIAVGGAPCSFIAIVLPGEDREGENIGQTIARARSNDTLLCEEFIRTEEDENGRLLDISFRNTERFNFAFDCVDKIAADYPDTITITFPVLVLKT